MTTLEMALNELNGNTELLQFCDDYLATQMLEQLVLALSLAEGESQ